jgi:hypothetical protein
LSSHGDFIRSRLTDDEEMLFGRLIKVRRASDLGLHGRWSEKVVHVAVTSKRLLIVSKNHKQEESAPSIRSPLANLCDSVAMFS